ncbi:MAG TPA: winged helix-turn-helix domain-containing protein [Solirubrobacterales bacterium]
MPSNARQLEPGRMTRAAVHCEEGEVELRLSAAGSWQLAIRRDSEREWRMTCSGDLTGGGVSREFVQEDSSTRFGRLVIDMEGRRAFARNREVRLSNLEYRLLEMLASEPCRVFTKVELLRTIWDIDGIKTRTLDSHASKARVKLRNAGAPGFLINCHGVGYKLCDRPRVSQLGS